MSCIETYSTLRIFSETLTPEEITGILAIRGTETRIKNPGSKYKHKRKYGMWLWRTKHKISSVDTEEHLKLIVEQFSGKEDEFEKLRKNWQIDVTSYFVTSGQGGPSISAHLMKKLSLLGLDIWWDVYIDQDE